MAYAVNREDLAWAAGLFEGEGCFTSRRDYRLVFAKRPPCVAISMTDKDRLDKFMAIVGMGRVVPLNPRTNCKPSWRWLATSFEECQGVVGLLWAWLGPRRREAAQIMLANAVTKSKVMRGREPSSRKYLSNAEVFAINERINKGEKDKDICIDFGVSAAAIWSIRHGYSGRRMLCQ